MKTLIGISSFGGLPFLEITLREIHRTVNREIEVFVIAARPDDTEMQDFLMRRGFQFASESQNKGFPANVNDLYDLAFVSGDFDNLIICGNDVVPMEGAIDSMIDTAAETDFEMVCGSEFNARFLVNNYQEAKRFFRGDDLVFLDFDARPWDLHKDRRTGIQPHSRKDIRNLTLFKRSSFEKSGYDDVNYWPNGYYADNAFCRRCDLLGVTACGVQEAAFFHFASRTIHQSILRDHGGYSAKNHWFFREQWGGEPGQEIYVLPFHGEPYELAPGIVIQPDLKIATREQEPQLIDYWSTRG